MLNKEQFAEYMQAFKAMQEKELSIYNNTDGVVDLLNLQEYTNLTELYITMLARLLECSAEDLWYYNSECALPNEVKTVVKNKKVYTLDNYDSLYDWLVAKDEICDCLRTYFGQDGRFSHTRCAGTKEQDFCDCDGDRAKCNFYWFDREGHSHIK